VPARGGLAQHLRQAAAVEDAVSEHQGDGVLADEVAADDEGIRHSARAVLMGIREIHTDLGAVAEQPMEQRLVLRRRDDEDVPDTREHQGGQRIIDHRLVEDRQELLRHHGGYRIEPGTRSLCQDNALHAISKPKPNVHHVIMHGSARASRYGPRKT